MQGLLDFIKTPEGQGLLSGVFGYAANARRGAPVNSLGRGGVAGLLGYTNALDRQDQQAETQFQRQYRQMQMDEMQRKITEQRGQEERTNAWIASQNPTTRALSNGAGPTQANASQIDPTQQQAYELLRSGVLSPSDYAKQFVLPKERKLMTVKPGDMVLDENNPAKPLFSAPEEIDPNKPFMLVDGKIVANPDYQQFELEKASRGASRSTVNVGAPETEYNKVIGKGLGEQNLTTVEVARNAPEVVRNAQAIRAAIQNGAITGTGAEYRQALEKALATVGLVGPDAAANTEALVAALGKTTLAAIKTSGLGAGNGFTDKDRAFLEQAASGQITATKENLLRVADLSERIARSNHGKGAAILQSWSGNPALKNFAGNTVIDPLPEARPEQSVVRRPAPLLPGYKQPLPTTSPKFLGFE